MLKSCQISADLGDLRKSLYCLGLVSCGFILCALSFADSSRASAIQFLPFRYPANFVNKLSEIYQMRRSGVRAASGVAVSSRNAQDDRRTFEIEPFDAAWQIPGAISDPIGY